MKKTFDAILLHDGENFSGNVGVFAAKQLRCSLNDGDAAAKAAKELAKFEADVPAADDQKMLGHGVQFHDGSAVEIRNVLQAFERRHGGAAASVDENFIGSKRALRTVLHSNLNRARAREAGFSEQKIEIGSFFDVGLVAVAESC